MWASVAARDVWGPRIQAVSRAWQAAEVASVQHGLRSACLQAVFPEGLPALAAKAAAVGLVALPLETQGTCSTYGNAQQPIVDGQPWDYRVAIVQPHVVEFMATAWAAKRDEDIGTLLGYPACCRAFFQRVWVEQGLRDTTWHMNHQPGPPEGNILLRWLGVRLVPHLPCGFFCAATIGQARRFAALLPAQERAWALDLLGWPMRWTARHGIAELETPCLKINMSTDVSPEFREVTRTGIAPAEGATGIRFPYNQPCAASTPLRLVDKREWTDNGFSSKEAMDRAHAMLLEQLARCTGEVLDLGAGNGLLLSKIGRGIGIESDAGKAVRARAAGRDVRTGRIQDVAALVDGSFVLALLSVRRLEEFTPDETARVSDWLAGHVRQILLYSYDEPMFARLVAPSQLAHEVLV